MSKLLRISFLLTLKNFQIWPKYWREKGKGWGKYLFPASGLLALAWFLIRVIPKPSRASYPCQRATFPLATGFVIWLAGLVGSIALFRKTRIYLSNSRIAAGCMCLGLALAALVMVIASNGLNVSASPSDRDENLNEPVGVAQGVMPGRVVWVHDRSANAWEGYNSQDYYWWDDDHTNQLVVTDMVSMAIRGLADKTTDAQAWDAIFRAFNIKRGKGDVGYTAGEKIAIKINNVQSHNGVVCVPDNMTMNKPADRVDRIDNSPQLAIALLRQLIEEAGVPASDLVIGDPNSVMPNYWYYKVSGNPELYDVVYVSNKCCGAGCDGRVTPDYSNETFYWSDPDGQRNPPGLTPDYIPTMFADADYVINIPVLKSHENTGGITVGAKNHFGSLTRNPNTADYYDMHASCPLYDVDEQAPARYRSLVDLMGHEELGGKTLLYLVDALFAGEDWSGVPAKWALAPFNNDWPCSILATMDAVAADSVSFDFLVAEWPKNPGAATPWVDDYLHEAALADDPPSGVIYDPENDGMPMASLGVHEHWNDSVNKQYTRNLGTGAGIELLVLGREYPYMESATVNLAGLEADDGVDEELVESLTKGKSSKSYSYLTHTWTLDIPNTGVTSLVFRVLAHHTVNSEGDDFVFAYSTDGSNYMDMVTVTKTIDDGTYQTYNLPPDLAGTLYIRVMDLDQTAGNKATDTLYVGHMYVEVGVGQIGMEPPAEPSFISVAALSSSRIDLHWMDNSDNEDGFQIERSTDATNFSEIALVGADVAAYSDTGLNPNTTYYYRIRAYNVVGDSGYSDVANATTSEAPLQVMHVSAITMKISVKGASAHATATVTVMDSIENLVSEAVVSGQWSGLTSDSDIGTTAIDGRIALTSDSINKKNIGIFTFCVTDVTKDGWTYDSEANVETCDSITR